MFKGKGYGRCTSSYLDNQHFFKKLKLFVAPFLDYPKLLATKVADYTTNGIENFKKPTWVFFFFSNSKTCKTSPLAYFEQFNFGMKPWLNVWG
jgi:hypothetical protein